MQALRTVGFNFGKNGVSTVIRHFHIDIMFLVLYLSLLNLSFKYLNFYFYLREIDEETGLIGEEDEQVKMSLLSKSSKFVIRKNANK